MACLLRGLLEGMVLLVNIPLKLKKEVTGTIEVRGEVYMPTDSFKELNKLNEKENITTFINSRNAAAGSLRQKDSNITATRDLRLLSYQLINHEGKELFQDYSDQLKFPFTNIKKSTPKGEINLTSFYINGLN